MTDKIIIIGGGFAGLSAGTALAERGYPVTLLEGRQVLGGRAYSFIDSKTGDAVDNGQHLFMGAYRETQNFLRRIGTLEDLHFQTNLTADFLGSGGREAKLRCWPLPPPLHLLSGLVGLRTLTWGDRFRLLYMYKALQEAAKAPESLDHITVENWLKRWKQSERARRHLWDLIAIATLNEDPSIAAAGPFATVLRQAFFEGRKNAQLGFAVVGLSDLYTTAARTFIESRGGSVRTKSPVERMIVRDGKALGVQLRDGNRLFADWVITAVPPPALLKLLPEGVLEAEPAFQRLQQLRPAPIISLHLWFDREVSKRAFVGLLDTHVQWFFNKSSIFKTPSSQKGYVSLVISGAHAFIDWQDSRLLTMAIEEMRRLFPKSRDAVLLRSLIIKEHQATLSPAVGCESLRPAHPSPIKGLLLAGDWTKTGLPATIESACVSGHRCAEIIMTSSPAVASRGSTLQPKMDPPLTSAGDDGKQLPRGMTEGEITHA